MPIRLEKKLVQEALRKHLTGKRKDAYVYGSMRRMGWKPKRETSQREEPHDHD